MRWDAGGELGIEAALNFQDAIANRALDLGQNDDTGFHSLELGAKMQADQCAPVRRGCRRCSDERAVDPVVGIDVMKVHDLEADERADRRSVITSLAQCLLSYMRDHPVVAAPP